MTPAVTTSKGDGAAPKLYGARLEAADAPGCHVALSWAQGKAATPDGLAPCVWLLALLDDGVVWGRREPGGRWRTSNSVFPRYSPVLRSSALWELRLFGGDRELLIWRDGGGETRGRLLIDTDEADEALRPMDEERVIVGDRVLAGPHEGFTVVGDAAGSRHAVPLPRAEIKGDSWPLRLRVRHLLAQESDSGVVRVAATRLVDVVEVER